MTNDPINKLLIGAFIFFLLAAVLSLAQPDRAAARNCEGLHSHEFCLENVP